MKKIVLITLLTVMLVGCGNANEKGSDANAALKEDKIENVSEDPSNFKEAHDNHVTELTVERQEAYPTPVPPEGVGLELVQYNSKVGPLDAYVSPDPKDNEKHPIVIWVIGGWGNSIDEFVWSYNEWENDQSGQFMSEAGILMMYPSFRGGNENPGSQETLYGEIDDIYSAYEYAKALPYVDPERIYLVGHSTGATRVLLASEYDDKFRAVFAFGAVDEIDKHNQTQFTFDLNNTEEAKLRSPKYWLDDVKSPTFLIEGEDGNATSIEEMDSLTDNENLSFHIIKGHDHFSYIAPVTMLVADKILADNGAECNIKITDDELNEVVNQDPIMRYPTLKTVKIFDDKFTIDVPAYWYEETENDEYYYYYEAGVDYEDGFNLWNDSYVYLQVERYTPETVNEEYEKLINSLSENNEIKEITFNSLNGYVVSDYADGYYIESFVMYDDANIYYAEFSYFEDYIDVAIPFIEEMIGSMSINN